MTRIVGTHAILEDGTCWSLPGDLPFDEGGGLEWRLRYGTPTKSDLLLAAGVISCYRAIIAMPESRRRKMIRELRTAVNGSPQSKRGK
jgi:hypothetical protein